MKVALLLGSFNPIHEGHLAILRYLLAHTDADQVRLVVSPESPFKEGRGLLDNAAQRLADARAAVEAAGLDVVVSDVEFHLPAPRYTIQTLRHLQQSEPDNEFVLVMGGDNIASLEHWHKGGEILRDFEVWVYPRPGSDAAPVCGRLNASGACKGVTLFAEAPQNDISSTRIRAARDRLVLFDLDGTLLDTLADLQHAVNHALALRRHPQHSLEACRKMVGHGVRNLVQRALPEPFRGDERYVDTCLASFKAYYTAHIDDYTRPYPGMQELLSELSRAGIKLAVVSNKFQEGTLHLIREFFPEVSFSAILGNRPGAPLKPDPAIVEEALAKAGVTRERAVLVGDSPTDIHTAANAGIAAVAVTWGYRTPEDLAGARLVHSVPELRDFLLKGE